MRSFIRYTTLALLSGAIVGILSGYLHINAFNIKVLDRKVTQQHYNWHDGVYEWDEVRANVSWEDAMVDIKPDYPDLLHQDLEVIAGQFQDISSIDAAEGYINTPQYKVKICVEDKQLNIIDSTLLQKHGDIFLSAYLELYDSTGCELLFKYHDRRFLVRDKFSFYGFGSRDFIINKSEELLYTEICEDISEFIWRFEGPYIWRQKVKMANAITSLMYKDWRQGTNEIQTATFVKK